MFGMTRKLRVWAYTSPVDMRKGFDGLCYVADPGGGLLHLGWQ